MKRPTRILILVGALLAVLLVLLMVLPVLYRDRIVQRVRADVNQRVAARVDWQDVGLTLFHDFPNVALRVDRLTVAGIGRFEGDTLATIRRLRVSLDLASVVRSVWGKGPIVVRSVELDQPALSLRVLEDGTANWDITKPSPEPRKPSRPLALSLQRFAIQDGNIALDNRHARLSASLKGVQQSLRGDFHRESAAVQTRAQADEVTLHFAGIPYLNRVRLEAKADLDADLANRRFSLKESEIGLNDLRLSFSGSATVAGDHLGLDLAFKAPSTDFKSILSLVPALYRRDFRTVQTSGMMAVSGRIQGDYGKDAFPAFALRANVANGTFRYPDLPLRARDIFVDLSIANPGANVDSTVVKLERFHAVLGREPIDAAMVLKTPVSDPDVDAHLAGKVDLADVARTVKLSGISELAGSIAADVALRTRMSFLASQQYHKVRARGSADVRDLTVSGASIPHPVRIDQASLRVGPRQAELRSFKGRIGSSDLQGSGSLDNLIGFALHDKVLRGRATVSSSRFDLDEWRSKKGDLQVIPVPPNLDFQLLATVGELSRDKLTMTNAHGRLRVKDQRVTLDNFAMNMLGGEIALTGFYETTNPARPTFDVGLRMSGVDIPAAAGALTTVQMLAPVARYARGSFSADLRLNGALGKDMTPLFQGLNGKGSLQTSQLVVQGFPALDKMADATKLPLLTTPTLNAIRASFQVRDGRLRVTPFDVRVGRATMNVAGSNGLDQSLDYTLRLRVPSSELGAEANRAVASLASRAGKIGIDLQTAQQIELGIGLGGTVTRPSVTIDLASVASSAREAAEQAVREAAERRAGEAAEEARQKAEAEADRLVREAEQRATAIREEAQKMAEGVKQEGYAQADALTGQATNPLARAAAQAAADRIRKETDEKAAEIVDEANKRADALVAEARKKANVANPQ